MATEGDESGIEPEDIPSPEGGAGDIKEYENYREVRSQDGSKKLVCRHCGYQTDRKGLMAAHFNPRARARCARMDWKAPATDEEEDVPEPAPTPPVSPGPEPPEPPAPPAAEPLRPPFRVPKTPNEAMADVLQRCAAIVPKAARDWVLTWAQEKGDAGLHPMELETMLRELEGVKKPLVGYVAMMYSNALHRESMERRDPPFMGGPGAMPPGEDPRMSGYYSYPSPQPYPPMYRRPAPWMHPHDDPAPYPGQYGMRPGYEPYSYPPPSSKEPDPKVEAIAHQQHEQTVAINNLVNAVNELGKEREKSAMERVMEQQANTLEAIRKISEEKGRIPEVDPRMAEMERKMADQARALEDARHAAERREFETTIGGVKSELAKAEERLASELAAIESTVERGRTEGRGPTNITAAIEEIKESAATTRTSITELNKTLNVAIAAWSKREASRLPQGVKEAENPYTEEEQKELEKKMKDG